MTSPPPATAPRSPPPLRDGVWMAVLGVVVRVLAVLWAWSRVPPGADGKFYHTVAERIANGEGYTWLWPDGVVTYAAHYPVGYPALVGVGYFLFGARPEVAMLLNALVGGVAVLATHRLCSRICGRKASLAGAGFVALSPGLVAYTPALMTEGLVATCLAVAAWLAVVSGERGQGHRLGLGALLVLVGGAATLVRPQSVLLMPLFGVVASGAAAPFKKRVGAALVITSLAVAVCLPWTARNCARMDRCVFVSANGGWNLLIGTFPEGEGAWVALDGPRVPGECREVFEEAAKDHCFGAAGRRRILAAPGAWFSLVPAKLRATFDYTASAAGYLREAGSPLGERQRWVLGALEIVARRLLVLAALVGAFRLGQDSRPGGEGSKKRRTWLRGGATALGAACLFGMTAWLSHLLLLVVGGTAGGLARRPVLLVALGGVAATVLVHAVFFGAGRYSMVLEPLLAPLAAVAFAPRARAVGRAF